MTKVLRFDRDQDKFHPAFAALSWQIRTPGKGFQGEVYAANAIWTAHDVREPFREVLDRHHAAGVCKTDFSDGEAVRKEINDWVAQQTCESIGGPIRPHEGDSRCGRERRSERSRA